MRSSVLLIVLLFVSACREKTTPSPIAEPVKSGPLLQSMVMTDPDVTGDHFEIRMAPDNRQWLVGSCCSTGNMVDRTVMPRVVADDFKSDGCLIIELGEGMQFLHCQNRGTGETYAVTVTHGTEQKSLKAWLLSTVKP